MDISPNVVIMTKDELKELTDAAFQRGVVRGKYEALNPRPVAKRRKRG